MAEEDDSTKDKTPLNKENPDEEMQEQANLDLLHSTTNKLPTTDSTNDSNHRNEAVPRREPSIENNPFSFRHFLHTDGYQNQGARPKVFCEARPIVRPRIPNAANDNQGDATMNKQVTSSTTGNRPIAEYSSALPDFVQDHLVMEQCYLGNANVSNYENMPDFTSTQPSIPLDLPIVRPPMEFPLDLPVGDQHNNQSRSGNSEVGNSKSLPDFLADGAVVRNQNNEHLHNNSPEQEVDRLNEELDVVRRQLVEQTRRADYLRDELDVARNKEREYTQNLAKALEQVEENLERSKKKALSSENSIGKLTQEVKILNREIARLKKENAILSSENAKDVASGGPADCSTSDDLPRRHRLLAQDLRAAATSAEHSLRQLLSGVENLRFLATKVDNMSRDDGGNAFNSDFESDEDAGPAL